MGDSVWNDFLDETIEERYELVAERVEEISKEALVPELYKGYFTEAAVYLKKTMELCQMAKDGTLQQRSLETCKADQEQLYHHMLPAYYEESYANPAYAVAIFGEKEGELLRFLRAELDVAITYAFEGKLAELTLLLELFVQVYNCFEEEDVQEAKQTIYWYFHDYSEVFVENQIREMIDPVDSLYKNIIMKADLSELSYLYQYGFYIGKNELGIAEFLNQLSEEEIQSMADTYTEGYRIGFEITGKDIKKKKTVQIHYQIGFERMIRAAIQNFEKIGLQATISREPSSSFNNRGGSKRGAYATSVNRQYDFDHKEDKAFYFDKAFVERRLEVLRTVFEQHKIQAAEHGGPAVLEVFGEEPFSPEKKDAAIHYHDRQQELVVYNASMSGQITNEYIKGEERSFTIIAYPIPEIGDKFKEIFAETVVINTLDYAKYQKMQQCIIDVLDTGTKVHITGRGGNRTDLTVALHPLTDPDKQTIFENCVADVNIPVGEVFTSPVLAGTNGTLHVSEVFLNGLQYLDLEVVFKDGMIESYNCGNFADEAQNKAYIRDNILMRHETLPMGEFAIGTNTTAYAVARKYGIMDKFPILIAEKTGPHFAVGDTCYSWSEDSAVYNPDGKEIIARDNEISLLRKEDVSKAYFGCHTDITIPYSELGDIAAVCGDGRKLPLIQNGRFVVAGTEKLNEELDG